MQTDNLGVVSIILAHSIGTHQNFFCHVSHVQRSDHITVDVLGHVSPPTS